MSNKVRYIIDEKNKREKNSLVQFARDSISGRRVVIKRRAYHGMGLSVEGNILKLLQHENLPSLRDRFFDKEEECIVIDYFQGQTLKELIDDKALTVDLIIDIFYQLTTAVSYLHNHPKGIVHRDISPSNIIVNERNHTLLIDFDVSVCDDYLETSQEVYGTIEYVAPEALLNTEMSGRLRDIYGIGACLQACLREMTDPYSLELLLIAKKAIALNPKDRYKDINQLKEDLQLLI